MQSTLITGPADRSGSAGLPPPFPAGIDDHDDDAGLQDASVPPAEAERARTLLDRLIEAICKPGEGNYNDP